MPMERSPAQGLDNSSQSRVDQYYNTVSPPNVQASKRQRPASSDEHTDAMSSNDMLKEILTTVRRLDNRVDDLDKKIDSLEGGMNFAMNVINDLKVANKDLKQDNSELSVKVASIENRLEELEIALDHEAEMRDANEANSRLINLKFSGIPKSEGETRAQCKEHVAKVLALIGSENGIDAIDVAHRKLVGGIIARFRSRCQRDEVYLKRFNLIGKSSKDLGFQLPVNGNFIYINESLSFDRSKLMKAIRDKLKIVNEGKGKDVRVKAKTAGGSILVQNHAGNFVRINLMKQFDNMY